MPEHKLDEIDRRIIRVLQADGRMSNQDLADKVGLSASPCARRVRLLEEAGIIEGYGAGVNRANRGLPGWVFASTKLERQREEELARFGAVVARWPEVADCYLMTGPRDYL